MGKLYWKDLPVDLSRAIREICKVDDGQKRGQKDAIGFENGDDIDETTALENEEQLEDESLFDEDEKLGEIDASDEKQDIDLQSPTMRSSDNKPAPEMDATAENEIKQEREAKQEIDYVNSEKDEKKADNSTVLEDTVTHHGSALDIKPSDTKLKGREIFDVGQVHYYRKKIRKPAVKADADIEQEIDYVNAEKNEKKVDKSKVLLLLHIMDVPPRTLDIKPRDTESKGRETFAVGQV